MSPRYQKILFFVLLAGSITMAAVLVRLRERAHDRLLASADQSATSAPAVAPMEQGTLMVANDADATLAPEAIALPLPPDPEARVRALLNRLIEMYAAAGALHPVPAAGQVGGLAGGQAVEQVFLMPVSGSKSGEQMAVVNLSGSFAANHPSGLETETLTVLSICATLHANLPQVTQVRFLVDGEERATLHGHADLTQTYLTTATAENQNAQDNGGGGKR
uniref:GerMN domain-containing protein n=1 Tax=mine drainage metagenome TaxID=410659 RepID=E6QLG3_9ZZZZ